MSHTFSLRVKASTDRIIPGATQLGLCVFETISCTLSLHGVIRIQSESHPKLRRRYEDCFPRTLWQVQATHSVQINFSGMAVPLGLSRLPWSSRTFSGAVSVPILTTMLTGTCSFRSDQMQPNQRIKAACFARSTGKQSDVTVARHRVGVSVGKLSAVNVRLTDRRDS